MEYFLCGIGSLILWFVYTVFFSKRTRCVRKLQQIANKDLRVFFNTVTNTNDWRVSQSEFDDSIRLALLDYEEPFVYIQYTGVKSELGAMVDLIEILEADNYLSAEQLYILNGKRFFIQDKFSEALEFFSKAIEINPESIEAYWGRVYIDTNHNNSSCAFEDLTMIIKLDANNIKAYSYRGIVNGYLNNFEDSIKDFTKAILLDPLNEDHYIDRCVTYSKIGYHELAENDADKALAINPNNMRAISLKHKVAEQSMVDNDFIHRGIKVAGYHIERGARTFDVYAK